RLLCHLLLHAAKGAADFALGQRMVGPSFSSAVCRRMAHVQARPLPEQEQLVGAPGSLGAVPEAGPRRTTAHRSLYPDRGREWLGAAGGGSYGVGAGQLVLGGQLSGSLAHAA